MPKEHPSAFDPPILVLSIIVAVVGAIIGMELITRIGITANTSIIGAMGAILIARLPFACFRKFRQINAQNLIQTTISGATFSAANALLLPIGIPFLLGYPELVLPMMIGASIAVLTDATILYWIFDTDVYPAKGKGLWPPGVATAEAILAAAKGGHKALVLASGAVGGAIVRHLGIPADVLGVSWIGNVWALGMFGIGLLVRGYSPELLGIDVNEIYLPHGLMIGAGLMALFQIIRMITRKKEDGDEDAVEVTKTKTDLGSGLKKGLVIYFAAALILAVLGGLITHMPIGQFIFWIIFAAFAAIASELVIGLSAMHAGWFPAFATALIFLVLGMLFGFPPAALALLVGFTAATGPAFADMAYDLKAGWILRGSGEDREFEMKGRKQQYIAQIISFLVSVTIVWFVHEFYFAQDLFPPVNRVFVATIQAGVDMQVAQLLLIWAIPGAIVQYLGGPAKQLGILFATGLLINFPIAGITVLTGIAIRLLVIKKFGDEGQSYLYLLGAGAITGAALYSFFSGTLRLGRR